MPFWVGYALVGAAAFFLGLNSIIVKMVYNFNISPKELLMAQYLIAVSLFWVLALIKRGTAAFPKGLLLHLFFLGALNCVTTLLFYYALEHLEAGLATMLLFTFPAYVVLLAALIFRERIGPMQVITLGAALGGSLLTLDILNIKHAEWSLGGILWALGAALGCAVNNLYSQHLLKGASPLTLSLYVTTFSALVLMLFQNPLDLVLLMQNPQVLKFVFAAAVAASFLPPFLLYAGINLIGASKASIVSTVELPFAVVMAHIFLGENISLMQGAGAALIFIGTLLLQINDFNHQRH